MPIGSEQLRARFIQLANQTSVDIWIAGVNAAQGSTFDNVAIVEIGSNFIRVTNQAGTINAIVPMLPISSVDDAAGPGATPVVNTQSLRSRLIQFVRQFTIDIYVTGTPNPAITNATVTEVGSDYILVNGTAGGVALTNVYLPLQLLAGFDSNTATVNNPNITSTDFRAVLVELSVSNSNVIINLGGRLIAAPVQIVEVQSNFIRLNNTEQTVAPIFWIGTVQRL
ncbi:hypothetical protein ACFVAD_01185 [Sutcliffiella sp. NPDC057660]|uniref:hypothetical protein n=1 Tax=Sutcliffiella sp. NPDC057660 TaxID=3346199 RepID=UPI00368E7432